MKTCRWTARRCGKEAWGNGLRSICKEAKEYDSVKFGDITVNETQKRILSPIEENNQISATNIARKLSLSIRAIEKNIKELREAGILVRYGAVRGGYWEVRNN